LWGGSASGMKWTVKLVAEVVEGKRIKHEIATIERTDETSRPTTLHALTAFGFRLPTGSLVWIYPRLRGGGAGIPGWPPQSAGARSAVRPARAAARELGGNSGMAELENVAYKRSQRAFFGRELLSIENPGLWPVEPNPGLNAARSLPRMSAQR